MVVPVFILPDGREISPMLQPPWVDQPPSDELAALPPLVRNMRGEWPCVPFGVNTPVTDLGPSWGYSRTYTPNRWLHGYGSNQPWRCVARSDARLKLGIDYPDEEPIAGLERIITPDPDAAAVDIELVVHPRLDCRLPVGLHPTLGVSEAVGSTRIRPGRFAFGRTYPIRFPGLVQEPPQTVPDQEFASLSAVPGTSGTSIDFTRLPFERRYDDLVQLCGIDGTFEVHNEVTNAVLRLTWDARQLPSCLVGPFSRGRLGAPFSGRFIGMEIEPCCSAFGLGTAISTAPNPIAERGIETAITFRANEVWRTRYRISAHPGPDGG